ncbi:unnamed protein product [Cercopithifilaria johnstoni]|uniref:Uncharacterized protein n=1 Tax=Cercopithifilaria johnstoni TaxID=2874296 RepID=A0A8J2LY22_9BILA|nr:unnamed protein product [Cercopithifilaria johnstoni]
MTRKSFTITVLNTSHGGMGAQFSVYFLGGFPDAVLALGSGFLELLTMCCLDDFAIFIRVVELNKTEAFRMKKLPEE